MKILLANPALSEKERKNPVIANLFSNAMPLGICYLAAVLIKKGIEVDIIDGAAERIDQAAIIEKIKKGGFDILGITSTSVSFHRARELAAMTKEAFGGAVPVILGGAHISAVPEEAMRDKSFDIGVYGEGEATFPELIETLDRGGDLSGVKGIYYRQDGNLCFTGIRPLIENLDEIPFPARHLLKANLYASLPTDVRRLPKFSILANRGCPFQCIFCDSAVVGKKYRTPSPRYLVDEMEHLKKDFGAKEIFFIGSTFTTSRSKTEEFLDILESRNLGLYWTCSTRVDVVDERLLRRMKKNGCWSVRFGIESGNQQVLDFIKKGITKEQVANAVKMCKKAGIRTKGFFIVGHLIDTPETIEESIKFAKSLPLTDVTVQINTPLPNTEQFSRVAEFGTLAERDYSHYSFFEPVYIPSGMTPEQLAAFHRRFYREFYWRPGALLQQLKKILNPRTLINYLKSLDLIIYLTLKR